MIELLLSLLGVAALTVYVYVGGMAGRTEIRITGSLAKAAVAAATWPVVIWDKIKQLYRL